MCLYVRVRRGRREKANIATVASFNSCSHRCACTILSTLPASVFDNFHNKKWGTKVPVWVSPTGHKALPPRTYAFGYFFPRVAFFLQPEPGLSAVFPLPHLPCQACRSCCVAGAFGLRVSSLLCPAWSLPHHPHPTLHPCKHHCTKEVLLAAGWGWHGPTTGSCPFSLDVPFILHQTGRDCVCVQTCLLSTGPHLMTGDH